MWTERIYIYFHNLELISQPGLQIINIFHTTNQVFTTTAFIPKYNKTIFGTERLLQLNSISYALFCVGSPHLVTKLGLDC